MTKNYFLPNLFCLLLFTGVFWSCECDDLSPELPEIEFIDLTINSISELDVDCFRDQFQMIVCTTDVIVTIANIGNLQASTFFLETVFDPEQELIVLDTIEFLAPNSSVNILVKSPAAGNCYDPNCTVSAIADVFNGIEESDEKNNSLTITEDG